MSDDELKDDEIKDEVTEGDEVDLEAGSEEPDFAPTSAAPAIDEEDDLEADPHSSFDTPIESEDPHMDIFGDAGVPGEDDDEEEEDDYDGDSNSF